MTIDSSRTLHGDRKNQDYAPHPNQSYLNPETLEVSDEPNLGGYIAVTITPGLTLRHELAHTTGIYDETHADEHAIAGLFEAADHMEETGSDEKYWAVFTTPEGITITKNNNKPNVI